MGKEVRRKRKSKISKEEKKEGKKEKTRDRVFESGGGPCISG